VWETYLSSTVLGGTLGSRQLTFAIGATLARRLLTTLLLLLDMALLLLSDLLLLLLNGLLLLSELVLGMLIGAEISGSGDHATRRRAARDGRIDVSSMVALGGLEMRWDAWLGTRRVRDALGFIEELLGEDLFRVVLDGS
jgi:hypothetical protein